MAATRCWSQSHNVGRLMLLKHPTVIEVSVFERVPPPPNKAKANSSCFGKERLCQRRESHPGYFHPRQFPVSSDRWTKSVLTTELINRSASCPTFFVTVSAISKRTLDPINQHFQRVRKDQLFLVQRINCEWGYSLNSHFTQPTGTKPTIRIRGLTSMPKIRIYHKYAYMQLPHLKSSLLFPFLKKPCGCGSYSSDHAAY